MSKKSMTHDERNDLAREEHEVLVCSIPDNAVVCSSKQCHKDIEENHASCHGPEVVLDKTEGIRDVSVGCAAGPQSFSTRSLAEQRMPLPHTRCRS